MDPPTGEPSPPEEPPRRLRDQLLAVRAAVERLVRAHIDLARTELGEIAEQIGRLAALLALSLGCLLVVGMFLPIGLFLFLGEWLFGSIGWGVLHGSLLLLAVAIQAAFMAIGIAGGRVARDLGLAVVVGVVVGLVLGLDLTNRGWTELGLRLLPGLDPSTRPLITAVLALAIVGGFVGLAAGWPRGGGATAGGLLGGAAAGALIGALTAIALGPRVGAGVGVTTGLITWPVLTAIAVARQGIDVEALKVRFYPSATIETAKETIEWLRERMPLGRKP